MTRAIFSPLTPPWTQKTSTLGSLHLNLTVSVQKPPLLFTFCLLDIPQLEPTPGAYSNEVSKTPKTRCT